jgi:predicted transposase YbfD/YdcC
VWKTLEDLPGKDNWVSLVTIVCTPVVVIYSKDQHLFIKRKQTLFYTGSLDETVDQFAQRIRDYWHVENKVHHVRDVICRICGELSHRKKANGQGPIQHLLHPG